MMRKTKRCDRTWLTTLGGRLVVRTCMHERHHEGDTHTDERGNWKGPDHG